LRSLDGKPRHRALASAWADRFPHLVVFMLAGQSVHVLAFMHPRPRPGS
jgi:hypothetical protein